MTRKRFIHALERVLGEPPGIDNAGGANENRKWGELSVGTGADNLGLWIDHHADRNGDEDARGRGLRSLRAWLGEEDDDATEDLAEDQDVDDDANEEEDDTPRSAPRFHEAIGNAGKGDAARVDAYLTGRGLPTLGEIGDGDLTTSKIGGYHGMLAILRDHAGEELAVSFLAVEKDGSPRLDKGGRKVRRTYVADRAWNTDAAFTLAPDGFNPEAESAPPPVIVEGAEDAIAVRAAGWPGAVCAVLGLNRFRAYEPPGEALLCFDADAHGKHPGEVQKAVDAYAVRGCEVRLVILPEGSDPADLVRDGRQGLLIQAIEDAAPADPATPSMDAVIAGAARRLVETNASDLEREQVEQELKREVSGIAGEPIRIGVVRDALSRAVAHVRDGAAGDDAEEFAELLAREGIPPLEPARNPRPLGEVLSEIAGVWRQALHTQSHKIDLMILWSAATYVIEHAGRFPLLGVQSPGFGTGKSVALELIQHTGHLGKLTTEISDATLFRTLEQVRGTILIDEAYRLAGEEDENDHQSVARRVLKGAHQRSTAWVDRSVKDEDGNYVTQRFNIFAPYVYALSGNLGTHISSRSIRVRIQRSSQPVTIKDAEMHAAMEPLRFEMAGATAKVRLALIQAETETELRVALERAKPYEERRADVWRVIFAVAVAAGGDWIERAHQAFDRLEEGVRPDLVREIARILIEELGADFAKWPQWIAVRELSKMVKAAEIAALDGSTPRQIDARIRQTLALAECADPVPVKNAKSWKGADLVRLAGTYGTHVEVGGGDVYISKPEFPAESSVATVAKSAAATVATEKPAPEPSLEIRKSRKRCRRLNGSGRSRATVATVATDKSAETPGSETCGPTPKRKPAPRKKARAKKAPPPRPQPPAVNVEIRRIDPREILTGGKTIPATTVKNEPESGS